MPCSSTVCPCHRVPFLQRHISKPPPHARHLVPLELTARPDGRQEGAHAWVDRHDRAVLGRARRGEHLEDPLLAGDGGVVRKAVEEGAGVGGGGLQSHIVRVSQLLGAEVERGGV